MKKFLSIFIGWAFLIPSFCLAQTFDEETIRVEIKKVKEIACQSETFSEQESCFQLNVQALNGSVQNRQFIIEINENATVEQSLTDYQEGDVYLANYSKTVDGQDLLIMVEKYRLPVLYFLIFVFVALVIWLGRKQGFFAVVSMILSFLILIYFVAQGIFNGYNAILVTFGSALLIMLSTLYLTYGLKPKTHAAFVSSFLSLVIACVLGYLFINLAGLTGFASEESSFLQLSAGHINMREILFAGIIIGALGLLDDITIGQSSAVFEINSANPELPRKEIYRKAMIVGKDHLMSMTNTLIIAYAGAAFPLFLLFVQEGSDLGLVLNSEIVAEEIIRMLVGSICLLFSVPLTTWIATQFLKKRV